MALLKQLPLFGGQPFQHVFPSNGILLRDCGPQDRVVSEFSRWRKLLLMAPLIKSCQDCCGDVRSHMQSSKELRQS